MEEARGVVLGLRVAHSLEAEEQLAKGWTSLLELFWYSRS